MERYKYSEYFNTKYFDKYFLQKPHTHINGSCKLLSRNYIFDIPNNLCVLSESKEV